MEESEACPICHEEMWVCEDHPQVPFNYGDPPCCGGAGVPCECNPLKNVVKRIIEDT